MSYVEWVTHLTAFFGGVMTGTGLTLIWVLWKEKRSRTAEYWIECSEDRNVSRFRLPRGYKIGGPGTLLP